jgi:2-(1,2-epoxy-1,2-dihydrophenyl)acetyl-CoA isomerase
MKAPVSLTTDNDLFSSKLEGDVLVIREKQHIQNMTYDIKAVFTFYDYLEGMLKSRAFKGLAVFSHDDESDLREHGSFLYKALSENADGKVMSRLANVVNRLIITLSSLNAVTVYAGRGKLSLFHLNLGLACDCRIMAEDAVFENPNVDIGIITKGSGYFLPRLLGVRKATEVLQWKSFSAEDALQLGLLDRIVPAAELEEETMRLLAGNMAGSAATLLGIRKLLKCDLDGLQRSLELEDQLIKDRLAAPEFREAFAGYCQRTFSGGMEALRAK